MPKQTSSFITNYKPTDFIDAELVEKASLWILRIIMKTHGYREFMDEKGSFDYNSKEICYFLGLEKYAVMDEEQYTRTEVLGILSKKLQSLEKRKKFNSLSVLSRNIKRIANLAGLNSAEERVLEFSVLIRRYEILEKGVRLLGNELNSLQTKRILSTVLDIEKDEIDAMFASTSKFSKSSLLLLDKRNNYSLDIKLDLLSDEFCENLLSLDEDVENLIQDVVKPCQKSDLDIQNYHHIKFDLDLMLSHLEHALQSKQKGVNILLYGLPGTGKTELAKVVAQKLEAKIYEVSYTDNEQEPIDGKQRLKAYKSAQALLSNENTLLMYDEAEDIFENSGGFFFAPPQRQKDKAWINRILESNTIPTIWITNNVESVDGAIVRRFDMSIEIPIPPKKTRVEIIKKYSQNILDEKTLQMLAANEDISPALISSATKVVGNLQNSDQAEAFTHLLNNTLKAQGYSEINKNSGVSLPSNYNPAFINTTTDLNALASGIKENKNARLCLYGPAGTGKSAFGKYIAEVIEQPVLLKKGSDLISKWVGGTEQNIARAFQEAKDENAVLIFDEVDTFLSDRENAKASWEVTQVNEMLVQMENFEGVFIATTNLMDNLDRASLRRFDLKLEFSYLQPKQAWEIFCSYAKELRLTKPQMSFKSQIGYLRYLTPGDFAAVIRQNRFRPIKDVESFIERLKEEVAVKNAVGKTMGFL
ncbi:ATP-binding protein [Sulfurimonas crateris]|uniref:ATP-binding protein n=1 Tax=Sulfurimonas crateris TaxID=2574727 RepID=A0A4U2Z437_9BACT|nr:ATP-binding protein [Sulfurimonas crateris]TKI68505.1 ATP-binding protein [Sulfurimonas crateris]